jgi:hypothetical protein
LRIVKLRPKDRSERMSLRNPSLTHLTPYTGNHTCFKILYLRVQWHLIAKRYRYAMDNHATEIYTLSFVVTTASKNIVVVDLNTKVKRSKEVKKTNCQWKKLWQSLMSGKLTCMMF